MTPSSKRGRTAISSILLLLFLPHLVFSSNPNFANTPHGKCPGGLKCHHGGICAAGNKDHSLDQPIVSTDLPWLEELNVNGYHCINCHEGYGGVDCGRKSQVCDAADPDAPTCFNGSACYKMGIDEKTGKYDYMCDCTKAAQHDNGVKYAGKYCQHVQEVICNDEMFCTNNGKCKTVKDLDGELKHTACECPAHRGGTHCEFLREEGFTDCRLQCDRGVCAKGFKSYDDLIGTGPFPATLALDIISSSGEHCVCPDGYTGLRCEIPVQRCGDRNCYHGSTCTKDDRGNPMCDCNSAHTDTMSYAGMSCEHEGTSYCAPGLDQDRKDAFCTNHGQCIDDPESRHKGCICEDGWTGDQCEIEGEIEPVCDLGCENGGSCRFGVKGYKDSYDKLDLPVHAKKQEDGMYCACSDGFTGLKCESDVNHCQSSGIGSDHFCLNGVPCDPGDPYMDGFVKPYSCQCDEGHDQTSQMLAGRFCEYAVTEFCAKDNARHSHSFCTNGGQCKKQNDHGDTEHHGCCCPEGYEGKYCQLPEGALDLETTNQAWSPMEECKHDKKSTQQDFVFPVSPNPNGEWAHITINPKFQVPAANESKPILESVQQEEPEVGSSNTGAIVSSVLFITLFVVGMVGTAYGQRSTRENATEFESNWWEGHTTEWWKGDTAIESTTNIAPAGGIQRSWSYAEDNDMSNGDSEDQWEDVVI